MTITNQQVVRLRQMLNKYNQGIAAAKSGMSAKTARKYLSTDKLPSEMKVERHWKTRRNVFEEIWQKIEDMLIRAPKLHAKTILNYLIEEDPVKFNDTHERTLQRLIRNWRANNGEDKEVIFCQKIKSGRQSQSDYTSMNDVGVKIGGEEFEHLLFHFMLPYSSWEWASICYSESFASLTKGYEDAVWELGYVAPEHRTDNLSAAYKSCDNKRTITENWQEFMKHYGVIATSNNPGVSHENGSVEKSHDLLKSAIKQQLMLRGSSNFNNIEEYKKFIKKIIYSRNYSRKEKFSEEIELLKALPDRKYYAPVIVEVVVSKTSTVRINKVIYSVPSRLIGYNLRAYIYQGEIKLYYGRNLVQSMPEMNKSEINAVINYRHIINSLVRKPGAFNNYYYREALFPNTAFRRTYDILIKHYPVNGTKQYLQILQMAAIGSESEIESVLELLIKQNIVPSIDQVKELVKKEEKIAVEVKVKQPSIQEYDLLLTRAA